MTFFCVLFILSKVGFQLPMVATRRLLLVAVAAAASVGDEVAAQAVVKILQDEYGETKTVHHSIAAMRANSPTHGIR